ncbi:NAD-dependent epimerase/dehydratase family protein [Phreatobacter stygius]|uniref:NAD-dependent epimerase/dehydratase family protein n=1 Tax=Phreatobacter stygius TaxID=1940610 RepID=A0A4D7B137_9HYPH|nr:NAD-dependent epimerase/dehydratase family protein [Phreatobacter stygius]QCI63750.1 NAD-dependent epimerase/dehydratase family protein [Phreatobacter stygius]
MNAGILVTGAAGFIGQALVRQLAAGDEPVFGLDIRAATQPVPGVRYEKADIRDRALVGLVARLKPRVVVHLASVVAAGGDAEQDYAIDVIGTGHVVEACLAAGVTRLVVTSSGAAYGYHADNAQPLTETDPLRGNEDFPYSRHKRLVENLLAEARAAHPALEQVVFRPCTVLGPGVSNQITAIFERPVVIGLAGSAAPFSLVSETDVVAALARAAAPASLPGIYNLAGDGTLSLAEIAGRIGKPYLPLPPALLRGVLWFANRLKLTPLGPAQVNFLQYRPVLANDRLKTGFGYVPALSAAEAFDRYWRARPAS